MTDDFDARAETDGGYAFFEADTVEESAVAESAVEESAVEESGFGHYDFENNTFERGDFGRNAFEPVDIEAGDFEHSIDEHEHVHDLDEPDDDEPDDVDEGEGELDGLEVDVAKDRHPSAAARRASWERPTRIAVGSLALIAIMFLFVFPTRSYLAQQRQVGSARHAVEELRAQNQQLEKQKQQLQTPAEIERLAREQFNMVLPGEHAYNVVSTATTSTTAP